MKKMFVLLGDFNWCFKQIINRPKPNICFINLQTYVVDKSEIIIHSNIMLKELDVTYKYNPQSMDEPNFNRTG